MTWGFNYNAMVQKQPDGSIGYTGKDKIKSEFVGAEDAKASYSDRTININKLAESILTTNEPCATAVGCLQKTHSHRISTETS